MIGRRIAGVGLLCCGLLCCGSASGCGGIGGGGPGAGGAARSDSGAPAGPGAAGAAAPAAVRQAARTHEVRSPPGVPQRTSRSEAAPARAVRDYAERYINWNAASVTAMLSDLAQASIGQARSAMELEAAQVASDPELAQNGIANAGTVEAVAGLAGSPSRYVVVTRERTTATLSSAYQGLRPAWHVTLAAVSQVAPGRWVVSGWQPEN